MTTKSENSLAADVRRALDAARPSLGVDLPFVTLFGSGARGALRADSDIDLGVAAQRPLTAAEVLELVTQLAASLRRDVDVVDLAAETGLVLKEALTKGQILRNERPELYASLLSKLVFDQADFEPLRSRLLAERRRRFLGS